MAYVRSIAVIASICGMLTLQESAAQNGPANYETKSVDATQRTNSHALRIDVDLVLVQAMVIDRNNRSISDLAPEHFRILEDKIEQQIEYFSTENAPYTVGIVFDVSGSMETKLASARKAASAFLEAGDRDDEYFIVEFSDAPELVQDFTSDISQLQNALNVLRPKGRTSLYDALYFALDKIDRGRNPRKALLLITDGEDNYSRYSMRDLKDVARERDVAIYGIGIDSGFDLDLSNVYGRAVLSSLAELSGGAAFFPRSLDVLPSICAQIGRDLKNQYVLGYRSHNSSRDGKWRRIQVKVNPPKGMKLHVRAKSGYYAGALQATK